MGEQVGWLGYLYNMCIVQDGRRLIGIKNPVS
jgi:hypothetical protein